VRPGAFREKVDGFLKVDGVLKVDGFLKVDGVLLLVGGGGDVAGLGGLALEGLVCAAPSTINS
jgi:hypothetical protein